MTQVDNKEFVDRHDNSYKIKTPNAMTSICYWEKISGKVFVLLVFLLIACAIGYFSFGFLWALPASYVFVAISAAIGTLGIAAKTCKAQWGDPIVLSAIIHSSHFARIVTDENGKIVYANKDFISLLNRKSPKDLDAAADLFEEPDVARRAFLDLSLEAKHNLQEARLLKLNLGDKRSKWICVNVMPMENPKGYAHWRLEDVTDLQRKEGASEEERLRLIDFTDNAPVGFFSLDEKGRFLFANATLSRWLGQDLGTLINKGKFHSYMVNPPTGDAAPYDVVQDSGVNQAAKVQMKGSGGRSFLASINQTVEISKNGGVRTRGVMHDLTQQQYMHKALKSSRNRFQRLFEKSPVGIAFLDYNGKIDCCNQELANIIFMDVQDISGQNIDAFLDENGRKLVKGLISKIRSKEITQDSIEVTLNGKDGKVFTRIYARSLDDAFDGADIVLHFINMTQRRALEEQFAQSQKMQAVGQLAGGIAHDFNNLLTAMVGFCDLLLLRHKPGDPSFSDIMQIKQNTNRASNLVRQILAFSRQQTLRPKVLDITEVLTELAHLLRRLIGSNIKLDIIHASDLWNVKVDEVQMEQVLINLAVNARDAMHGGGELCIETSNVTTTKTKYLSTQEELPSGDWVCITVSDTGCGMDEETMSRILDPFFTTKEQGKGTGLGLSTVYGIIRQTNGYLDIVSSKGEGTKFYIYLPKSVDDYVQEIKDSSTSASKNKDLTGSDKILLVEDEDAVRSFSQRALEGKGYSVMSATCGTDALNVLEQNPQDIPELLVTDVVMPEMDGPTLSKILQERFPTLKVIFISGYTEDRLAEHMGDRIWFLSKPFTLRQLAEKVKEVLESH